MKWAHWSWSWQDLKADWTERACYFILFYVIYSDIRYFSIKLRLWRLAIFKTLDVGTCQVTWSHPGCHPLSPRNGGTDQETSRDPNRLQPDFQRYPTEWISMSFIQVAIKEIHGNSWKFLLHTASWNWKPNGFAIPGGILGAEFHLRLGLDGSPRPSYPQPTSQSGLAKANVTPNKTRRGSIVTWSANACSFEHVILSYVQ